MDFAVAPELKSPLNQSIACCNCSTLAPTCQLPPSSLINVAPWDQR